MSVDNLSMVDDLLILVAVAVFWTGVVVWYNFYRKDIDRAQTQLRAGGLIALLLAVVIGIIAMWGELTYPFTGGESVYNTFFFDPLTMLAILLGAFGITVYARLPTHYAGILGILLGGGVIYYGYTGYNVSPQLTKDPLETFLLYLAFGALAIASIIPTLFVDLYVLGAKDPSVQPIAVDPTPSSPRLWTAALWIFLGIAFLAGLAALLYGFNIAWGHLAG